MRRIVEIDDEDIERDDPTAPLTPVNIVGRKQSDQSEADSKLPSDSNEVVFGERPKKGIKYSKSSSSVD